MLTLLKNLICYSPEFLGKKDILLCNEKIYKIQPTIEMADVYENIYDLDGLLAFPSLIDQHLHIIGGGGEDGFASRINEIGAEEITAAGVSTVVGILGADSCTKSLEALYAKAKALEIQGLTAYIYAGSYSFPPITITKDVIHDLVYVDKVIGVKTALSDHRSTHPNIYDLLKLASDTHLGGMLSGKAGVVHIHIGDGKRGLKPLLDLIRESDLDLQMFVPTHVNRSAKLFSQAKEYCKSGGSIDLTSGETAGISVPAAIHELMIERISINNVTVSSDANGSIPSGGTGCINSLYKDIIDCINQQSIPIETAFSLVTKNVAEGLKLYPSKGTLSQGSDADILITDQAYNIKMLFCRGKLLHQRG